MYVNVGKVFWWDTRKTSPNSRKSNVDSVNRDVESAKKKEMFLHTFLVYIQTNQNVSKKDFSNQFEKKRDLSYLTQYLHIKQIKILQKFL